MEQQCLQPVHRRLDVVESKLASLLSAVQSARHREEAGGRRDSAERMVVSMEAEQEGARRHLQQAERRLREELRARDEEVKNLQSRNEALQRQLLRTESRFLRSCRGRTDADPGESL